MNNDADLSFSLTLDSGLVAKSESLSTERRTERLVLTGEDGATRWVVEVAAVDAERFELRQDTPSTATRDDHTALLVAFLGHAKRGGYPTVGLTLPTDQREALVGAVDAGFVVDGTTASTPPTLHLSASTEPEPASTVPDEPASDIAPVAALRPQIATYGHPPPSRVLSVMAANVSQTDESTDSSVVRLVLGLALFFSLFLLFGFASLAAIVVTTQMAPSAESEWVEPRRPPPEGTTYDTAEPALGPPPSPPFGDPSDVFFVMRGALYLSVELRCPSGFRYRAVVSNDQAVVHGVPAGEECAVFFKGSEPAMYRPIKAGYVYSCSIEPVGVTCDGLLLPAATESDSAEDGD